MDSREPPTAPPQVVLQQTPQQQPPPNMLLGPTSSYPTNSTHSSIINAHSMGPTGGGGGGAVAGGLQFSSVGSQPQSQPLSSQVGDGGGSGGMNAAGGFDGSSPQSSGGMRFSIEPAKKKRGRPRKYTPDGNIALGLSPTPNSSGASGAHADSGGGGTPGGASEPTVKRNRGRPPSSGRKQLNALGGVGGVGFTPHVITVKAGEDVASKIMAFSQQGPRTVCILSANGAICNVTLRQPAMSGGMVTYELYGVQAMVCEVNVDIIIRGYDNSSYAEGRFEIISLSGSFLLSENNSSCSRTGGLSVSLAGSDGRVLGGGVAGMLIAVSTVQVIVGSFVADKKSTSTTLKSGASSAPPGQVLNFGTPMTTASPPSRGASSESSDENGGSPLNRSPGIYGNVGQPMHSMQMYQLWAGQNPR